MSIQKVREYLAAYGAADRIREFDVSSATVELAAKALGCAESRIAKTLSFMLGDRVVLVVAAGDVKVDNRKYKDFFGGKAKMLAREDAERLTGARRRRSVSLCRERRRGGVAGRVAETLRHRVPRLRQRVERDRTHARRAGKVLPRKRLDGRLQAMPGGGIKSLLSIFSA